MRYQELHFVTISLIQSIQNSLLVMKKFTKTQQHQVELVVALHANLTLIAKDFNIRKMTAVAKCILKLILEMKLNCTLILHSLLLIYLRDFSLYTNVKAAQYIPKILCSMITRVLIQHWNLIGLVDFVMYSSTMVHQLYCIPCKTIYM